MSLTLVTGAAGFVGRGVVRALGRQGFAVRAATRRPQSAPPASAEQVHIGDIDGTTDWSTPLTGIRTVVHLAARAHVLRDAALDPPAEFRRVNVDATANLARRAAAAGVRRFVFISSIGVNGPETFGVPFTADDKPAPHSTYAVSKHDAEVALRAVENDTGMEVVVIRSPMVIGPGAPGNFDRLLRAVYQGIPLPLGAIHNRRSFLSLDNLGDLIITCLTHPAAAHETFLASDDAYLSTPDVVRQMAATLGRPDRLIPVPVTVLRLMAKAAGRADLARQLCGSLQVDTQKTRNLLQWAPRVKTADAITHAAGHFLTLHRPNHEHG